MNKHTPTPWALNTDDIPPTIYAEVNQHCIAILDDSSGAYKFDDVATCEANATHIVRCVNSHEALVKALEELTATIDAGRKSADYVALQEHRVMRNARAALAAAGTPQ